MVGLSMNPDNHGVEAGPRLAAQIAKEEEELGMNKCTKPPSEIGKEKKKAEKVKLGPFELDTTYPRTIPGFIRIVQVLTLIVSFICLLLTSWPDSGTYTFYCIFLVFGALISGYLLFTIMAGNRGKDLCGVSWVMVELVFFGVFGLLIFIGACLAANKSQGKAALNAGAVFGFFSFVTFVYYFYITWKSRGKKQDEEGDEEKENPAEGDVENEGQMSRPQSQGDIVDDYRLEMLEELDPPRHQSMSYQRQNSLPNDLNEQLYENGKLATDFHGHQRRRNSNSDKDSAYSEGTSTPRGKSLPNKIRRTGSGYRFGEQQPRGDYDHVMDRQPLSHMTHRTRHGGSFRGRTLPQPRSMGYPQEIHANSFTNLGFESDDLHRHSGRRKSMPEWLRAALGEDVKQDDMIDDESEPDHQMSRRQTLPPGKEYPLLNTSDEESICYPSVSQNGLGPGARMFSHSLPHHQRRRKRSAGTHGKHHHHHHHHNHHGEHGRRRMGSKRHHHRHHHHRRSQHRRGPGHHQGTGGRRPVNGAHEDYLRRMMENDELVMQRKDTGMQGFQPMEARPIETGKRRVIPEQPISIHFPEQSRWDDDNGENPVMAKYFADEHEMRG